uniref:Uncharacterized protein n=1 Tax=Anopheles maculatus TaxID=74869 RepID=A0A182SLK6_9DIPT
MSRILRTYDAVTAARVRKAYTLDVALEKVGLTADEVELLETHAEWRKSARLRVIQNQTVEQLQALKLPPTQGAVNTVCTAVFENCKRMFEDAELYGEDGSVPLAKMHSALFRGLAAMGCVQTFFEQLIVICEQDSVQTAHQRRWAAYWAQRIAAGFQLLKEFKKHCSTLPPEQVSRCGQAARVNLAQSWYAQRLKCATNHQLMLGLYVDCPWHLKLPRAYVMARLMAMNEYTKDIVPILLTLQEPPLSDEDQQKVKQLTQTYYAGSNVISGDPSSMKHIPTEAEKATNGHHDNNREETKIYTAEDLKDAIANIRNKRKSTEEATPPPKRAKQYGPWTEADITLDWGKYPLGTYHT